MEDRKVKLISTYMCIDYKNNAFSSITFDIDSRNMQIATVSEQSTKSLEKPHTEYGA